MARKIKAPTTRLMSCIDTDNYCILFSHPVAINSANAEKEAREQVYAYLGLEWDEIKSCAEIMTYEHAVEMHAKYGTKD